MLVQYMRKTNNEPYGCLVALDKNKIGWSLCNPRDIFSKELGKKIAIERAKIEPHYVSFNRHLNKANNERHPITNKDAKIDFYKNIPEEQRLRMENVRREIFQFEERVHKYFK